MNEAAGTPLDIDRMREARDRNLTDTIKEVKVFSRRAHGPEDRAALAELEKELLLVREKWSAAGMLPGAQMELAGA